MARRVASAEEAVQKYGQHLSTPAAQGESTVPLPKEFEELRQRTLALQEEEYWVAHSLQDEALEFRLQAVAFVSHGAAHNRTHMLLLFTLMTHKTQVPSSCARCSCRR